MDVRPSHPAYDVPDIHLGYTEARGKGVMGFASGRSLTDCKHLSGVQFGESPTLHCFVGIVLGSGAGEKVVGADAGAIVAMVADRQFRGNRAGCNSETDPVGFKSPVPPAEDTVTVTVNATSPFPAAVALGDLRPKPKKVALG